MKPILALLLFAACAPKKVVVQCTDCTDNSVQPDQTAPQQQTPVLSVSAVAPDPIPSSGGGFIIVSLANLTGTANVSAVGPSGITVTMQATSEVTATLSVTTSNAACGEQTVAVTVTDAASTATANVTVTIADPVTLAVAPDVGVLRGGDGVGKIGLSGGKCSPDAPALSVSDLPPGISASLVAKSKTEARLTLSATNAVAAGTNGLVTMHAGGQSAKQGFFVVATATLRVADQFAAPLGATIRLGGVSGTDKTSDANTGLATYPSAPAPYSVAVDSGTRWTIFRRLRRADPTLTVPMTLSGTGYAAQNLGSLTHTGGPAPASTIGAQTVFAGESDETSFNQGSVYSEKPNDEGYWVDNSWPVTGAGFTLRPSFLWTGGVTKSGVFHTLRYTVGASNQITSYNGYATRAMLLDSSAGLASFPALPLASVETNASPLALAVTVPTGGSLNVREVYAEFGFRAHALIGLAPNTNPAPYETKTPDIPGATLGVAAGAAFPDASQSWAFRTGLDIHASAATVSLASPPSLIAPAPTSIIAQDSAAFSWSPFAGAVYVLVIGEYTGPSSIAPTAIPSTSRCVVVTDETSVPAATCPAFATGNYYWFVQAYAPLSSVDEAADRFGFSGNISMTLLFKGPDHDGEFAQSTLRMFTI